MQAEIETISQRLKAHKDAAIRQIQTENGGTLPEPELLAALIQEKMLNLTEGLDEYNLARCGMGVPEEYRAFIETGKKVIVGTVKEAPNKRQDWWTLLMVDEQDQYSLVTIYSDSFEEPKQDINNPEPWVQKSLDIDKEIRTSLTSKVISFTREHSSIILGRTD